MDKKVKAEQKPAKASAPAPARLTPFEEMERWFEDSFPRRWGLRRNWPTWGEFTHPIESTAPRVDVIDRDDEVVVKAEVPGFKKEDLDISLIDNAVTIKGSSEHEEKEEKGEYYRCEIARGSFSRTIGLPATVDTAKAKASFKDGIVELVIPKVAKNKRRKIKIS